ncbi:uncharacterized protein LOC125189067 isoform X2 [Salvia hispanica]|uniref:uncharacterized protein LOC125189067 isoform X2 n=1 Tax=Salvia hispanica TaxID=49212 RepID=UPI002008F25A|nr:uncharacterized protein LOC125189067 isoform X2 [Salvia hispanica]
MDLGLMASHSCPPGMGAVFNPEHPSTRLPKELHRFLQYRSPNQDLVNSKSFNLCLQQKDELKFSDVHLESLLLGFGIAEQCTRHEKILELLASGSIKVENGLLELSMLYDMMGPRNLITDSAQQPLTSCGERCICAAESLVYPARELYMNEPKLNIVGDRSSCREHMLQHMGDDMTHMVPIISDLHFSKNTVTSRRRAMLVPYFEWRRRGRSNMDPSKLATEKVEPLNSHVKEKVKTSQKRKASPKTMKERDIPSNSYLYACESLLSIIVNRKQQGRNAIASLKKSGPQLNDLLTGFSASIAGTGVAVVLGVVCRVLCNQVPFCASKLLSTGFGLGLVWLSSAVNRLKNTVISISKSSGKLGAHEEEMMDQLDRNLKDVWFRVAAVMTVAVLQLA